MTPIAPRHRTSATWGSSVQGCHFDEQKVKFFNINFLHAIAPTPKNRDFHMVTHGFIFSSESKEGDTLFLGYMSKCFIRNLIKKHG